MTIRYPYDKRHLNFGNSSAIKDPAVLSLLSNLNLNLVDILQNERIVKEFINDYKTWIESSKLNKIKGLADFNYACYSNGTTEAFDKFYLKNNTRRFRCFHGEYMYHQLMWRNCYPSWEFISDCDLDINDAVVISLPFADTGNQHSEYKKLIATCEKLNVPVLVDCAYLGICQGIEFDFSSTCITDVTFSLSKTFPISHARIGLRLTRSDNDDSLFVVNKGDYVNRLGAYIGSTLIKNFSSDYIVTEYRDIQTKFCNHLKVVPSNTVLFGIGNLLWNEYNRGRGSNRLSFHNYYHLQSDKFYEENSPRA
jgi:hypothetical protein